MTVEAIVRWTNIEFTNPDLNRSEEEIMADKIINGGESAPSASLSYSYSPMCFEMDDVRRFNKPSDPDYTVIRMIDGDNFVVKIPYVNFRDLWTEATGKSILSVTTEDEEKPEQDKDQKGKRKNRKRDSDSLDDLSL